MYQGQSLIPAAEVEYQIAACARVIIQIARKILERERLEFRFLVFPIFLAGMASKVAEEKQVALNLIRRLEDTSFGSNTRTTRNLLTTICEKQGEAIARTGSDWGVSWIEELESSGEQLIILGL